MWEAVLKPGDQTLEFHIPGGEPLDQAACGESFRRSLKFFAKYFPEITPRAIYVGTWLLDPQLREMLPAMSNLVRFQREMYLYPVDYGAAGERQVRDRAGRARGRERPAFCGAWPARDRATARHARRTRRDSPRRGPRRAGVTRRGCRQLASGSKTTGGRRP